MELFCSPDFALHIKELARRNRAPGLSIAVVQNDRVESAGFGMASIEHDKPCTADTLFDIASSSKSLTAASIGLLVDDNENYPQIQYDSVMSELLPDDFVMAEDEYTKGITIDDILGHRTGMPGHDDSCMGEHSTQPDNAKSITRNLRNLAPAVPLRSRYLYCNMMYTVATHLVEVKANKPFSKFLEERFFQPLGMDSSSLQPNGAKAKGLGDRLAKGHIWDKKTSSYREIEARNCPEGQGAGSVISSANDMIKWIKAIVNQEGPINENVYQGLIKERSSREPKGGKLKPHTSATKYTAGMEVYWYRGHAVYGHNGVVSGFGSRFILLPEFKFGAVVLGNAEGTNSVAAQLFRDLIDEVVGVAEEERTQLLTKQMIAKSQKDGKEKNRTQGKQRNEGGSITKKPKEKQNDNRSESAEPQTRPLSQYMGYYWNAGYHGMKVEIKDDALFIDATDRSMGFTLVFEHQRDQTKYIAHLSDFWEGGDDLIPAEFAFDGDRAVKMGLDLEPLIGDKIWFERKDSVG
ncbi:hypothetical protein LCI18_006570 [Fusarium solani-melongenae]|uniref:Uncharacterized protein n=1 Tax=Fusarium solani subsp. cucurbitae TaxID=2747967 RepID=A0ACD3Z3E2_FUSSC|nr:hypothetical protein LCI18_006570 [Fusarium solani-melongenae]